MTISVDMKVPWSLLFLLVCLICIWQQGVIVRLSAQLSADHAVAATISPEPPTVSVPPAPRNTFGIFLLTNSSGVFFIHQF